MLLGAVVGVAAAASFAGPALGWKICSTSPRTLHAPHARDVAGRHSDLCADALAGHYYVEGVGYATIQAILHGSIGAWFLLLLYVCKLLATSVSLGSGSSGGIFSPSLFMGATLGGAFAGAVWRCSRSAHQRRRHSRWSAWARWSAPEPARR